MRLVAQRVMEEKIKEKLKDSDPEREKREYQAIFSTEKEFVEI
jgi:hypothetical protein